jgi:large conductance mechanosensitive channel
VVGVSVISEFNDFLNEYKVTGLAIAFIMGAAVTAMVGSLVNDIIMPFVGVIIPGGDWRTAVFNLGPIAIKWGSFLSALINFTIIAFVVFMLAKVVIGESKVAKK